MSKKRLATCRSQADLSYAAVLGALAGFHQTIILHSVDDFGDGRKLGHGVFGYLRNAGVVVLEENVQHSPTRDIQVDPLEQLFHGHGVAPYTRASQ